MEVVTLHQRDEKDFLVGVRRTPGARCIPSYVCCTLLISMIAAWYGQ
jgi:hypothetical protein